MRKVGISITVTICFLAVHIFCFESGWAQVSVSVAPAKADVTVNKALRFGGKVSGTTDQRVTWSITSDSNGNFGLGSINTDGLYTAPKIAPPRPVLTIQARSVADPSAVGTASVLVRDIQDYTHSNVSNDLLGHNYGPHLKFTWVRLPGGAAKMVFSWAPTRDGPWTEVKITEDPETLTSTGSAVYTNADEVPPDAGNDYFYKLEAFSATGLLLKSYSPVFLPKFARPA